MSGMWTNEPPETPALPLTGRLMAYRENQASPLETALARSRADEIREEREAAATAVDPDERAANMVARGIMPGMVSQLHQRLGDTLAELAAEREKIEKAARRAEIAQREHAAGRIDVWGVQRMLDGDQGDAHRAQQLERRADRLREQIREATELMAPQQERAVDGVEAAASRAHTTFVEVTRQRMAAAQAGQPAAGGRRPFVSRSGGDGQAVRSEMCLHCTDAGVDDETSYLLHSDPELNVPVTPPERATAQAEAERLVRHGYSRETAEYAAMSDAELAEFGRQVGVPYRPGAS